MDCCSLFVFGVELLDEVPLAKEFDPLLTAYAETKFPMSPKLAYPLEAEANPLSVPDELVNCCGGELVIELLASQG